MIDYEYYDWTHLLLENDRQSMCNVVVMGSKQESFGIIVLNIKQIGMCFKTSQI